MTHRTTHFGIAVPASATHESDSSSVLSAVEAKPLHSATPADLQPAQYRSDSIEEVVEEYDALEDDEVGEFDGPRLRRTRLFRGYEIDDIAGVTKVTGSHLRNIEAENFNLLPADVYVRGFLTAYAKTIGLDPDFVVPSYMARVQQSRGDTQRVGFLGRR